MTSNDPLLAYTLEPPGRAIECSRCLADALTLHMSWCPGTWNINMKL